MAVDDVFEPEPGTTEVLEIRTPRSFDSGYHEETAASSQQAKRAVEGTSDLASGPLAKADSGYGSNASLRSSQRDSAPTVPAKEPPPTPPKERISTVASSSYSKPSPHSDVSGMTIKLNPSLPALPTKEMPIQPFGTSAPSCTEQSVCSQLSEWDSAALPPNNSTAQAWCGQLLPDHTWSCLQSMCDDQACL